MPRTKGAKNKPKLTFEDLEIKSLDTDNGKKKILKNNYYDLHIIPNHPCKALFAGASKSGKTTLICNLIINPNYYGGYFHNIFIFSPNSYADEEFEAVRTYYDNDEEGPSGENRVEFIDNLDEAPEVIEQLMDAQKKIAEEEGIENTPRILIILDDFIDHKKLVNSKSLQSLFTRGRHYNISTWVSVQAYNACPLKCRKQLNNLIVFGTTNEQEIESLKEYKHRKLTDDEFHKIFDYCTADKYNFMHINLDLKGDDISKMYRKKFLEVLDIQR